MQAINCSKLFKINLRSQNIVNTFADMKEKKEGHIIFRIQPSLRDKFKTMAKKRRTTVSKLLNEFVILYTK